MANDESEKSSVSKKRNMTFRRWLARHLGGKFSPSDEQEIRQVELQKSLERLGLELSSPENGLEADEREMIHGIVELGTTEVREVMVPRVDIVGVGWDRHLQMSSMLSEKAAIQDFLYMKIHSTISRAFFMPRICSLIIMRTGR